IDQGAVWDAVATFAKDIRPIFESSCWTCHGDAAQLSKFDLRTRESALRGGARGSDIVPGDAEHSRLYRRVAGLETPAMPAPRADRYTLVRRAYLDLLGLPPTPAQVAAFVDDQSPGAWERLVDTLLASPHYGERYGRMWLDVARYADSAGFEYDMHRPNAWRYRDYVIASFNDDKPYDRFLVEQIAGDEMDGRTDASLIATGFL